MWQCRLRHEGKRLNSNLNSLVNNAFKYTRDRIRIGARREDGYTAIFIEENDGDGRFTLYLP